MTQKKISFAIAGSTQNTTQVTKCLAQNPSFDISLIITPQPKKIGRKQIVTTNPLDNFASEHDIQKIYIDKLIDRSIENKINEHKNIDILLVVDFGYYIPKWLLKWPRIAPLNIHPSALPQWRGSSPGQFSLLFGDKKSAVTLMMINSILDQGDILHQEFFEVGDNWTQTEYYKHSFDLICKKLPELIQDFVSGEIKPKKQPEISPYPIARQLTKEDSFVDWEVLQLAMLEKHEIRTEKIMQKSKTDFLKLLANKIPSNPLLTTLLNNLPQSKYSTCIYNAYRAFSPWPGLWTLIPTSNGTKRMKILKCTITPTNSGKKQHRLVLKTVQIEGKNPVEWKQVLPNTH